MPRTSTTQNEPTKKHGDKMEPLIDEVDRDATPEEKAESIEDESAELEDEGDVDDDDDFEALADDDQDD